MPHLQGTARDAIIQFPPTLDEYITPDNPVRFMDAFVDQLDLVALGFERAVPNPLKLLRNKENWRFTGQEGILPFAQVFL